MAHRGPTAAQNLGFGWQVSLAPPGEPIRPGSNWFSVPLCLEHTKRPASTPWHPAVFGARNEELLLVEAALQQQQTDHAERQ